MKSFSFVPVGFLFLFLSLPSQAQINVRLFANNDSKQIQFAVGEIQTSLIEKGQESVVLAVGGLSIFSGISNRVNRVRLWLAHHRGSTM